MIRNNPIKNNHIIPGSYGLVVCGGRSSRMGIDKSMLTYYEKPQRYHVYELLQPFCEKVFISCNEGQANSIENGYNILTDQPTFKNIGPMAALLTAFTQFPKRDLLVIGCDYPFLTSTDLQHFLPYCKKENFAVSFYNDKEDLYEPLLARYRYTSFDILKKMHEAKKYSLQHFLKYNQAIKFYPGNKNCLTSIDTQEAFIKAGDSIKQ